MPHRDAKDAKDASLDRLKADRTVTAAEATRNFGRLQEEVAAGPITLTHHGRARMILLSPEQFESLGGDPKAAAGPTRTDGMSFVLDEMEEGFVAIDENDRFAAANRVAEFYFGRRREDLIGQPWHQAFPKVARSDLAEILDSVRLQGRPRRLAWDSVIRDGRRLELNIFPIPNALGWIGVVFSNVGEMERLTEAAALSEALVEVLIAAQPGAGLAVSDAAGAVVAWHGAAADLFGWTAEDLIGHPIERLCPESDLEQGRLWAHFAEARRKGVSEGVGPRLTRSGELVEIFCRTTWLSELDVFVCVMRRAAQ